MPLPRVLMYHGFGRRSGTSDPQNLFVSVEDFERQVRFLARAFRPLDLTEFLDGLQRGRWPRRSVLLTIDDGYVSTLEVAAPVLKRHGVPAVAFVCPRLLGGRSAWMPFMPDEALLTADQVTELPRHGIEVGAHSLDHTELVGLDAPNLRLHTDGAARALHEILGVRPRAFAYPDGRFDQAAVRAVEEAEYQIAFSIHVGNGRFAVRRRDVNALDTFPTFAAKLLPGFDSLERTVRHPILRRVAARALGQRKRLRT